MQTAGGPGLPPGSVCRSRSWVTGAAQGHAPQPSQPCGDISGTSVWGQMSRAPSPALPVQELCRLPARPPRLARGCCIQQEAKCWEEKPLVLPRARQLQPGHPGWAAGGQGAADGVRTRRALRAGPDRSPSQHRASQAACLLPRHHAAAAPSTKPCRLPRDSALQRAPSGRGIAQNGKFRLPSAPSWKAWKQRELSDVQGRGRGTWLAAGRPLPPAPTNTSLLLPEREARGDGHGGSETGRCLTESQAEREERVSEGCPPPGAVPGPGGPSWDITSPGGHRDRSLAAAMEGPGRFTAPGSARPRAAASGPGVERGQGVPGGGVTGGGDTGAAQGATVPVPRLGLIPASPVGIIQAPSGPGLAGPASPCTVKGRSGPGARLRNVICLLGRPPWAPRVPAATCPTDPWGLVLPPDRPHSMALQPWGGAAPHCAAWSPQPTRCP